MSSFRAALFFAAVAAIANPAFGVQPKRIGKTGEFTAYRFEEGGSPVCYVLTRPDRLAGQHPGRGEAYVLITHRPAEGTKNVISITAGYGYKPGSDVNLIIGDTTFVLFTKDDTAWAPDQETDDEIAADIRKARRMTVEGISDRDIQTTDVYDLRGSDRALSIIDRSCRQAGRGPDKQPRDSR